MSEQASYRDRLREEEQQLSERLSKLGLFIDANPNFDGLVRSEQIRLELQRGIMAAYLAVLRARLVPRQMVDPAELPPPVLRAVEIAQTALRDDLLAVCPKVEAEVNMLNDSLKRLLDGLRTYDELSRYRDPAMSEAIVPPDSEGREHDRLG